MELGVHLAAVDCGATNGIWVPDEMTRRYFETNGGTWPDELDLAPDPDAPYDAVHSVDVSELSPQIAIPYSPGNVRGIEDVEGERVHQVFIGSCAGGRIEEIREAASLLSGKRNAP